MWMICSVTDNTVKYDMLAYKFAHAIQSIRKVSHTWNLMTSLETTGSWCPGLYPPTIARGMRDAHYFFEVFYFQIQLDACFYFKICPFSGRPSKQGNFTSQSQVTSVLVEWTLQLLHESCYFCGITHYHHHPSTRQMTSLMVLNHNWRTEKKLQEGTKFKDVKSQIDY